MTISQTGKGSTVVGVFEDTEDARDAIESLKDDGFDAATISVLAPDKHTTQGLADDTGTQAGAGAATGALAGGILGGLGGWLIGIGALAIPGVGPFIAAGAFATALGGAALGAGVGAIAGALVGMGVPEEHAKYYEGEAKAGKTLVTVQANARYDDAQRIMRENGAYDVESRHGASAVAAESTMSVGRDDTLQLREEELVVDKQRVETGRVAVSKDVVTEQRTLDVPVTREEVTIERTPVDRRPSDRPLDDGGETISIPVREEQIEVEKRSVVYEEVAVGTRQVQATERVSDTVRREEARIEQDGDVIVSGAGTGSWDQAMPSYRQRWQERYGNTAGRWEDAEPGYRFGYEMRNRPDYRGRGWSDVEPELRRDWNSRNSRTPWEQAKDLVRDTWENTAGR